MTLVPLMGTEKSIEGLNWSGAPFWAVGPKQNWTDNNNNIIGQFRHYGQLTFAIVNDSGHD